MKRFRGFGAFVPPPSNIAAVLQNASVSSGVPYPILSALAYQESSYNPNAVSGAGAQGLLQLMPATGASLGVSNPFDAQQNAIAGAAYLKSLYDQYGDWNTALIAYNEGPGNLANQGPFSSSQSYAASILQNAGVSDSSPSPDGSYGLAPASPGASTDLQSTLISGVQSSLGGIDPLLLGGIALGALALVVAVAA